MTFLLTKLLDAAIGRLNRSPANLVQETSVWTSEDQLRKEGLRSPPNILLSKQRYKGS